MSDSDPISFRRRTERLAALSSAPASFETAQRATTFDRSELTAILDLYGRKVAAGAWRDYAIDQRCDKAVFSVFRMASEFPLFRIEKDPRLARKQGAYSVVAPGGRVMKRGNDLRRVLGVLEDRFEVVSG
ncbi:MAG: DUF2794 domain-containing protein [Hyphomicrobium sp.]